jgi:hypothetical protein
MGLAARKSVVDGSQCGDFGLLQVALSCPNRIREISAL